MSSIEIRWNDTMSSGAFVLFRFMKDTFPFRSKFIFKQRYLLVFSYYLKFDKSIYPNNLNELVYLSYNINLQK